MPQNFTKEHLKLQKPPTLAQKRGACRHISPRNQPCEHLRMATNENYCFFYSTLSKQTNDLSQSTPSSIAIRCLCCSFATHSPQKLLRIFTIIEHSALLQLHDQRRHAVLSTISQMPHTTLFPPGHGKPDCSTQTSFPGQVLLPLHCLAHGLRRFLLHLRPFCHLTPPRTGSQTIIDPASRSHQTAPQNAGYPLLAHISAREGIDPISTKGHKVWRIRPGEHPALPTDTPEHAWNQDL